MEKEDRSPVEDAVDAEILEAVSPGRRDLKISNVKLKIVGEDLSVSQEFKEELELSFSCQGPACKVCFSEGMLTIDSVHLFHHFCMMIHITCVPRMGSYALECVRVCGILYACACAVSY